MFKKYTFTTIIANIIMMCIQLCMYAGNSMHNHIYFLMQTYTYQRHMLSDVWSYGVLLWETFFGGDTPYPGMTNRMISSQVRLYYY